MKERGRDVCEKKEARERRYRKTKELESRVRGELEKELFDLKLLRGRNSPLKNLFHWLN